MILPFALICICLLGYLAQTTGLCMVRGVNEWKAGNPEFLLAIISSGALAWVAMSFSYYSGTPLNFRAYDTSIWFALGGGGGIWYWYGAKSGLRGFNIK